MANTKQLQELRTTLTLDGDQFSRSAKEVQADLRALRSEMNYVKAGGKEYQNSMEGLTKQSDILSRQLEVQKKRLEDIKKRYDEAVKASGENSAEARRLQAQYNNVAAQIRKTERQLESINKAIKEQSNSWLQLSKRAKTAGESLKDAGEKIEGIGNTLSTRVTAPIIAAGTLAVETTREFRLDLARLETNAKQAGVGMDVANDAMRRLNAITGETDSNVEALSNLLATGMNADQLEQAIEQLSGAVIKFPDTLKIESLADGLQETLATGKSVGQFAELLERMGVNLDEFDEGLSKAAKSGDEVNYVLKQLNKLKLDDVTNEFRKANKELVESREAQYDFMTALSELGRKLEPIATRITTSTTQIIDKFNELDPATQDMILKFAGLAAAAGPVTVGLGKITTGAGTLLKGFSSLANTLGKASGGTGLLARIAGLGTAGPVGLAVAGVGALSAGIYAVVKATQKSTEEIFNELEARQQQIEQTDEMIERFETLQAKNQLSNDEMLRFMDIQSELEQTTLPERIEELQEEQAKLLEKSGLTNEEMQEFLEINDKIIEQAPETEKAISSQGNAYAKNVDELRKINEEKLKSLKLDAEQAMQDVIEKQNKLLREQKKLVEEINQKESELQERKQNVIDLNEQIRQKQEEIKRLQEEKNGLDQDELVAQQAKIDHAQRELEELYLKRETEENIRDTLVGQLQKRYEALETNREELQKLDETKWRYEEIVLAQIGLNAERGKGLETIQLEIAKLMEEKEKLEELHREGAIATQEYQEQVGLLDNQISKLQNAQDELKTVNELAGETIYKDIEISNAPKEYAEELNEILGRPITKRVDIITHSPTGPYIAPLYAEGTDYHPGGPAIVGEEGPELARIGNKMALLDFGVWNLPRGTEVFTHEETKKILSALNRIPAYAEGVGTRNIEQILQSTQQPIINQHITIQSPKELDPYEIARLTKNAQKELALQL